jgi:hypothetical protein
MEYRKALVMQAKIDTSEIGPAIEAIKRQFNTATAPASFMGTQAAMAARMSQQGLGSFASIPKADEIAKSRRQAELFLREESQQQERAYRELVKYKEKWENLEKTKKESLKSDKESAELEKEKLDTLQKYTQTHEQFMARNRNMGQVLDVLGNRTGTGGGAANNRNLLSGADWSGVMPAPKQGVSVSNVVKGVGTVLAIADAVASTYQRFKELPMQRMISGGAATQSILGEQLSGIGGGDVVNQMAWLNERQRSMTQVQSQSQAKDITDRARIASGGIGAMGRLVGIKIGDENISDLFTGNLLNTIGMHKTADQYLSKYESARRQEEGVQYQQMFEAQKQSNPLKDLAANRLQQRFMTDLAFQRMTGLGEQGFSGAGGFQELANKSGFNDQIAMAMASQIQGGGGSTRGMQGLGLIGMQAQRGFDLTNAGGVLGRISGVAGGSKESEQIFRKVMEESIKAGLDKSDFAEEQRRFADMTSEILSKSGVRTGEDAANVLSGFMKFVGGTPTIRGLEGIKSAYQQTQGFTAETAGRGGALQFAAFLKNPTLRTLGAQGLAGLAEMPEKDLIASNPYVIAEAAKLGIDPEILVREAKTAKRESLLTSLGLSTKKVDDLNNYLSKHGMSNRRLSAKEVRGLPQNMRNLYSQVYEALPLRYDYGGAEQAEAAFQGLVGGQVQTGVTGLQAAGQFQAGLTRDTGRTGDAAVAATGVAAQAMLENFRNFRKEVTPASDALDAFTKKIILFASALAAASDIDKPGMQRWIRDQMAGSSKHQVQGRNPAPRGTTSGW